MTPSKSGLLIECYRIYYDAEGKSPKTIETMPGSVKLLGQFLAEAGLPTSAESIGPDEIRAFILDLRRRPCYGNHPYARPQESGLPPPTPEYLPTFDPGILVVAQRGRHHC